MAELYRIKNRTSSIVKFQDIVGEATRLGIYDRITSKRVTTLAPNATIEIVGSDRLENSLLQGQLKALVDNGTITVNKVIKTEFMDDFFYYVDADTWTLDGDTNGSAATIDGAGGLISISSGTTADNEGANLSTTNEIALFAAGKDGFLEGKVKTTDGTVGADYFFGLADLKDLTILKDDSAGPAANFDGALFYKLEDETTWRIVVSNDAVQTTADTGVTWASGESRTLKMEWTDDGITLSVSFFIDDIPVGTLTSLLAGQEETSIVMGAKGQDDKADTLVVDYVQFEQIK